MMTARTPISYLLELSSRRGITPQYDLMATEGRVHEPTFVFKCTAGQFSCTGEGTNKKVAKHEAAYHVLQQMMLSESSADHPEIEIPSIPATDDDDPEMQNPVGKLQEIAQKNKYQPPSYEYEIEPETKDFVCIVSMAGMEERGVARSKKVSKKIAAKSLLRTVLDKLDNIPDDMRATDETQDDIPLSTDSVTLPPLRCNQEMEDAQTLEDIAEPHMVGLRLKNPKGVAVEELKKTNLDEAHGDGVEQLRLVAEEQNWIIQYHELPPPSPEQCLVLVEVSRIKPHIVYHGTGRTMDTCKNQAATNMLDYIKKMILIDDRMEA